MSQLFRLLLQYYDSNEILLISSIQTRTTSDVCFFSFGFVSVAELKNSSRKCSTKRNSPHCETTILCVVYTMCSNADMDIALHMYCILASLEWISFNETRIVRTLNIEQKYRVKGKIYAIPPSVYQRPEIVSVSGITEMNSTKMNCILHQSQLFSWYWIEGMLQTLPHLSCIS